MARRPMALVRDCVLGIAVGIVTGLAMVMIEGER